MIFYGYCIFFKCGFCYTYINVLAVGLFIACDGAPYNKNVVTKVGHYFLKLLDKHFPRQHKLHKIFNKNTVKVSYSCTKNIKSIISSHNKRVLHQSRPCPN